MKIIKLIKEYRNASEDEIKNFIYRNMSDEMISGLEYDDPKTMARALKLFGIDPKTLQTEDKEEKGQQSQQNQQVIKSKVG